MSEIAVSAARKRPLGELAAFIREHLTAVNAVILLATSIVAVLDFLMPKAPSFGQAVYTATGVLGSLLLLAAFAPNVTSKLLSNQPASADHPLWKRPVWQCAVTLLLVVSGVGFASVSKAADGGLLGSKFPEIRRMQESLLAIGRDVAEIGVGVRQANSKLDRVVSVVDPDNVADRCPDLECALQGGASSKTIRRLFEKGARVPGNPINDGELLRMAAISRGEGRMETVDLIFQHGVDRNLKFLPRVMGPGDLTREGVRWARAVVDTSLVHKLWPETFNPGGDEDVLAWNEMVGCFLRDSKGLTLLELAAHLISGGSKLPPRPLACAPRTRAGAGYARVVIDPGSGKVLGVKPS